MKVILLFDYHSGCPTCGNLTQYREYELSNDWKEHMRDGGRVSIEFEDPWSGNEIFIAKKI